MKADVLTMAISTKIVREEKTGHEHKTRPNYCHQFFGQVRGIFIFLFGATVWVFAFCHRAEMLDSASSKVGNWSQEVSKKSFTSNKIHQDAINYEMELDEITK